MNPWVGKEKSEDQSCCECQEIDLSCVEILMFVKWRVLELAFRLADLSCLTAALK